MDVASRCGEQEAGVVSGSGWNLWVWLLGVVVRRYIDFLVLLISSYYLSLLLLYLFFFAAASLLFVHFLTIYMLHTRVRDNVLLIQLTAPGCVNHVSDCINIHTHLAVCNHR